MPFFILFIVCYIIHLDSGIFKKQDTSLYQRIFTIPLIVPLAIGLVVALLIKDTPDIFEKIPSYILLFGLAIYLFRRERFFALRNASSLPLEENLTVSLVSDAYGVILKWIFFILSFAVIMRMALPRLLKVESEMVDLVFSAIFSTMIILFLIYNASQKFSNQGFLFNVGLCRGQRPFLKVFLIPAVVGLIVAIFAAYLIVERQAQPQTPLSDVLEDTESSSLILIFLVLALFIAPLAEEIIFRGYFFHVIRQVKGERFAIYFIALTFAVLHVQQYWGDWMAIVMVAILGFLLTLIRVWAGTTLASATMHYVYNTMVTIIPVIMMAVTNPSYIQYKAYGEQYDTAKKIELLEDSIAKKPFFPEALNDLAGIYAGDGIELDKALSLIERAIIIQPKGLSYQQTKAAVLYRMGRYEESLKIRQDLLRKNFREDEQRDAIIELEELVESHKGTLSSPTR